MHEHRFAATVSRSGARHRLGVATHLAGNVGEALRPGPIDRHMAEDLADMLELLDEGVTVNWPQGQSAMAARRLLEEYHLHQRARPPPPALTLAAEAPHGTDSSSNSSSIGSSSPPGDLPASSSSSPRDDPLTGGPPRVTLAR